MEMRTVQLTDPGGRVIASAVVSEQAECFAGTVGLSRTPADLCALFDEFEEVVNGQILSLMDDIEDRIAALELRAVFNDEFETRIRKLQVFPGTGGISFCVAELPAHSGAGRREKS